MPKYFGTDGVRGVANTELTPELAFKLGEAAATFLAGKSRKLVIGRDTRISGDLLESALIAGICAAGVSAHNLGIVPTPAIAYLTRQLGTDGGVVISASHNPAEYNGIKFFDAGGVKLSEDQEDAIEELMERPADRANFTGAAVGRLVEATGSVERYVNHLIDTTYGDLEGMRVAIDCANGAAYQVAPQVFKELGAEVAVFCDKPDGININRGCGSTHLEYLSEIVKKDKYDLAVSFDGDADRVLAVDENGSPVDGDFIMAICATHLDELDMLQPRALVTTVMTNVGFDRAMSARGIDVIKTAVGDRYVLQEMIDDKIKIGGEQSGHIIFLDHNTTGDGIITALQLLAVIRDTGKPLSQLAKVMTRFPQVLKNIKVSVDKEELLDAGEVRAAVSRCESELGDDGRVLVRASGTEPLVRVMVEAKSHELAEALAADITAAIENRMKTFSGGV